MTTIVRVFRVAVLVLLTGLVGCSSNPSKNNPGEVKVGVVLSLSGPASSYGKACLDGLKLAIDKANERAERKIKLVVLDDKSETAETVSSFNQLINASQVVGIIGATASTNTLAGAKVAQESRVPLLVPMSTNARITQTGEWVSRICFNDPFQGRVLAQFARNDLKAGRAVLVVDKSIDYSVGLAETFKKYFAENGGTIAGEAFYSSGDAEYSALIAKVKAFNPDVIFIPGQDADVGPMLKQARDAWMGIPKLGGDGWDTPRMPELAGAGGTNCFVSSHFSSDDPTPKVQEFVAAFKAKYGEVPGAMSCLGYDAGLVLVDAVGRVQGEVTAAKLKDAINATKNVAGVSGTITLTSDREVIKDGVILELTREGFKFKTRIKF